MSTIVRVMLGERIAGLMRVFAGDVVPRKKPDPAIYLLAARELAVDPARCVRVCGLPAAAACVLLVAWWNHSCFLVLLRAE